MNIPKWMSELRATAKAATPGPWLNGDRVETCTDVDTDHADIYREDPEDGNCTIACATCPPADAEHIAAANPKVILWLLDMLEHSAVAAKAGTWEILEDAYEAGPR